METKNKITNIIYYIYYFFVNLFSKKAPVALPPLKGKDPYHIIFKNETDEVKECTLFGANKFIENSVEGYIYDKSTNFNNDGIIIQSGMDVSYEDAYSTFLLHAFNKQWFKTYKIRIISQNLLNLKGNLTFIRERNIDNINKKTYTLWQQFIDLYQGAADAIDCDIRIKFTGELRAEFKIQPKSEIHFLFYIEEDQSGVYIRRQKRKKANIELTYPYEKLSWWNKLKFKLGFKIKRNDIKDEVTCNLNIPAYDSF